MGVFRGFLIIDQYFLFGVPLGFLCSSFSVIVFDTNQISKTNIENLLNITLLCDLVRLAVSRDLIHMLCEWILHGAFLFSTACFCVKDFLVICALHVSVGS